MIDIQDDWENFACRSVGLINHFALKVTGVEPQHFIKPSPLDIVQIHRRKHRQQKEPAPQTSANSRQRIGLGTHHGIKEVSVAILILAPVFKEVENRVELVLRVRFELALDGDVAPLANFLRNVGRVENKLRLEKGIAAALGQKP